MVIAFDRNISLPFMPDTEGLSVARISGASPTCLARCTERSRTASPSWRRLFYNVSLRCGLYIPGNSDNHTYLRHKNVTSAIQVYPLASAVAYPVRALQPGRNSSITSHGDVTQ